MSLLSLIVVALYCSGYVSVVVVVVVVFVCFDSLHPINNLSVKQGQVF